MSTGQNGPPPPPGGSPPPPPSGGPPPPPGGSPPPPPSGGPPPPPGGAPPPPPPGGAPPPPPSDNPSPASSGEVNYEILWDCEYCDAKKLLGLTHRYCPQCGAQQNPDKRYFPPEGEEVVAANHEFAGADKNCENCDTPNSSRATFCVSCGSPMDGSKAIKTIHDRQEAAAPPPPPPKSNGKIKWIIGGIIVFVILCVGILSIKEERGVTVTGHSWERGIDVEVFASVSDEAWEDDVPLKAYDKSCREKQKDTKKVEDGEECHTENKDNGDGTFKKVEECTTKYKEVPVYGDYCTFKIDKWTTKRTEKANGNDLSPAWPNPTIKTCPGERLGCEREGPRTQSYTVYFKDDDGDQHECAYEEKKWKSIAKDSSWKMQFGKVTGGIDCDFDFKSP